MITYPLSALVDFPAALVEFAEDFAHDYNIDDTHGFIDRLNRRVTPTLEAMIFATVQIADHRLVLHLTPHRRLLGECVAVHRDMIREGAQ